MTRLLSEPRRSDSYLGGLRRLAGAVQSYGRPWHRHEIRHNPVPLWFNTCRVAGPSRCPRLPFLDSRARPTSADVRQCARRTREDATRPESRTHRPPEPMKMRRRGAHRVAVGRARITQTPQILCKALVASSPSWPLPWGLDRPKSINSCRAISASHTIYHKGRAIDSLGDRRDSISGIGHQDDQTVSEDIGRVGRKLKAAELIKFIVAELDPSSQICLSASGLLRG
jgi:hypothetical protein